MRARNGGLRVVLCILLLLTGCAWGEEQDEPSYSPIPDAELQAQIEQLPGVTRAEIRFIDEFESGRGYHGEIWVTRDTEPKQVLDQAIAILRQGRYQASMGPEVLQPRGDGPPRSTTIVDLGISGTEPGLTERYGPQPGNGEPPADS